ncbi:hypothetical protein CC80DRAFT_78060 [Byssothecium circinans]|uniref:SUN domain-containing protein n=1 Tax=Byssothecium circinans TaxID=147558 RepID=A0A6A5TUL7_9PLEO|nr:hypothetical protein CC80DRAFT_78060 [Byssothecium circinans]
MARSTNQQGGPTPRRSARASTVARSIASQSVASASGNAATPSRKSALPKLNARQSTAYGASGRIVAAEELHVPATGFIQAFDDQRGAAVARGAQNQLASGALHRGESDRAESPSVQGFESENPSSEPSDNEEDVDQQSIANTSKSFGMMREAGMLRPLTPPGRRSRAAPLALAPAPIPPRSLAMPPPRLEPRPAPTNVRQPNVVRPAVVVPQVAEEEQGRSWFRKEWLFYVLGGLFMLFLGLVLAKPGNIDAIKTSFLDFIPPPRDDKFGYDRTTDYLVDWVKGGYKGLDADISDVRNTVLQLRDRLPDLVVVHKDANGSFRISDEFWNALASKMKSEVISGSTSENWKAFLDKNDAKIQEIFRKSFDPSKAHPHVINRREFLDTLEKNWNGLSELVDKKIAEVSKNMEKELKKAVNKEVKQAQIDQIRLQSLAITNLLANAELTLRKPNYFSPGLGAFVNTRISSPTAAENPAWLTHLWRSAVTPPDRRPPVLALEEWREVGDCWCAAPSTSKKGKTQLAINLGSRIFPNQLTIEHIPMTMTPGKNIASAPKNVELWVKTDTLAVPGQTSSGDCEHTDDMPEGWICLGSVKYDIFGANHVQTFDLQMQTPTAIDEAVIRVTENWGADRTCIYRVRLHGEFDGPDYDYTPRAE